MVKIWGSWILFQELLQVLAKIGKEHKVSISTVAVRWVLDYDFVGAVIVGARMGVSEHVEGNKEVFGWNLSDVEKARIQEVLGRGNGEGIWKGMGDCGGEYR
jgi:aryl-alcohol dehydrogenase-like predicted oxidoreductase